MDREVVTQRKQSACWIPYSSSDLFRAVATLETTMQSCVSWQNINNEIGYGGGDKHKQTYKP
jgi:hypothetical protein